MQLIGLLLTLFGVIVVANYRILSKRVLTRGKSEADRPAESVLNAGVFWVGAVICFSVYAISGDYMPIQPSFWLAVAITGVLNIVISLCAFQALKREQASLVVPIFDTTPAFIVFVAMLVTGEFPTLIGYIGILFLVLGTYTLNIHEFVERLQGGKWTVRAFAAPFLALGKSAGVRFAMLGAACGCVAIAYDAVAARSANPIFACGCIFLFPAVMHTVRALVAGYGKQFFDTKRAMPSAALLGALYALACSAYIWSFRYSLVAYQATVKRIETFVVLVLAYFILKEKKNFRARMVAVGLMFIGMVLINWQGCN
jgi:drug/metabolite transporter (DMT)-like permease